jgi:hypothetical protein
MFSVVGTIAEAVPKTNVLLFVIDGTTYATATA